MRYWAVLCWFGLAAADPYETGVPSGDPDEVCRKCDKTLESEKYWKCVEEELDTGTAVCTFEATAVSDAACVAEGEGESERWRYVFKFGKVLKNHYNRVGAAFDSITIPLYGPNYTDECTAEIAVGSNSGDCKVPKSVVPLVETVSVDRATGVTGAISLYNLEPYNVVLLTTDCPLEKSATASIHSSVTSDAIPSTFGEEAAPGSANVCPDCLWGPAEIHRSRDWVSCFQETAQSRQCFNKLLELEVSAEFHASGPTAGNAYFGNIAQAHAPEFVPRTVVFPVTITATNDNCKYVKLDVTADRDNAQTQRPISHLDLEAHLATVDLVDFAFAPEASTLVLSVNGTDGCEQIAVGNAVFQTTWTSPPGPSDGAAARLPAVAVILCVWAPLVL